MSRTACFAASFLLAAASSLDSQEPSEKKETKVGIGVMIAPLSLTFDPTDFLLLPIGMTNLIVPIRTGRLTVEPEFGLFRFSDKNGPSSSSFTNVRLGVGVLVDLAERGDLRPYVGPRVGFSRNSMHDKQPALEQKRNQSGWYLGIGLGAQYFFSPHFSLGGEAQLTRTTIGEEKSDPPLGSSGDRSNFITTAGVATLRFYF